jgi:hypothetical protein
MWVRCAPGIVFRHTAFDETADDLSRVCISPGRCATEAYIDKVAAMWVAGYLFAEAAWNSRQTTEFLAVGDPLITK